MADTKFIHLAGDDKEIQILRDIKVPDKMYKRVQLDLEVVDHLFGGDDMPGLVVGTSILFTGSPGAGKTTAAIQFGDRLQRIAQRNVLYNCGEMSKYMMKMMSDRIGVNGDFTVSLFEDVNDLMEFCEKTGVEVLFIDSIQQLTDREHSTEGAKSMWKLMSKKLHKFAKRTDTIVFIIGHVTKGGDFAGPMEMKHDLDIHAHMRLSPNTQSRVFQLTKNRFGPSGIPYEFTLNNKGIDFSKGIQVEETEASGGGGASERTEGALKLIKEKLLTGEKISGYCFSRFEDPITKKMGVEVSGGTWRTLVERAKNALKAEGHIVGECKINGRTHFYVEI